MVTGKQPSSDIVAKVFVMAIEISRLHDGVMQHPQEAWSQKTANAEWGNPCHTLLLQLNHEAARSSGTGGLWVERTIAPSC